MIRRFGGPGMHGAGGLALCNLGVGVGQGAAILPCYYLTFDGGDLITLAGIALTRPFTVAMWLKRRVGNVAEGMFGQSATSTSALRYGAGGIMVTRHAGATQATGVILVSTAWEHIAWIARSSVAVNALFRNGVDVTDAAGTTNANAGTYNRIGAALSGTVFMDGQMAAIGIAPGELDVATLYAAGTFHKPLNPATFTLACWNMRQENGAGASLTDESAGGNTGTFGAAAAAPTWAGTMITGGPVGWSDS